MSIPKVAAIQHCRGGPESDEDILQLVDELCARSVDTLSLQASLLDLENLRLLAFPCPELVRLTVVEFDFLNTADEFEFTDIAGRMR